MEHGNNQPNYEKLEIWKEAIVLAKDIYALTRRFPMEERFGLVPQLQRAAVSVSLNIAEGHGRKSKAEFRKFLLIAKGSLQEVMTLLVISLEFNLIRHEMYDLLRGKVVLLIKKVQSLINSLQRDMNASS